MRCSRRGAAHHEPARHHRLPRRGHHRAVAGRHTRDTYVTCSRPAREADLSAYGGRGQPEAQRHRPLPPPGRRAIALENARAICEAAPRWHDGHPRHGGPHDDRRDARHVLHALRADFPWVGAVVQSYLSAPRPTAATSRRRAVGCGCARAPTRSRPPWPTRTVTTSTCPTSAASRCSWPARATPWSPSHDPRLIDIAAALAGHHGRAPDSYEFQMLSASARTSRSGSPTGATRCGSTCPSASEWYGYLVRRMAERPANTMFFLRSLATNG
jgi:proline dehydrogenase